MGYPSAIVEISFASGIYVENPTWVDVTSYVREITTRRGRTDPFQDFGAGTATIVLDNRDRRFDPLNTAGPYYGQLTPRRQIRIRATNTVSGTPTTYPVFRGYVTGWPVSITDAGFDSTVTIEAFDAIGLLETEEIPDDLADAYIRSLNPQNYWPLTDPIDPQNFTNTRLADYGSDPYPLAPLAGISTANGDGLAEGLPDTSVLVADTNATNAWSATAPDMGAPTVGTTRTFMTWYRQPNTTGITIIAHFGVSPAVRISYNQSTSTLSVTVSDMLTPRDYTATVYLDITIPHHIAVRTSTSFTQTFLSALYVDGIQISTTGGGPGGTSIPNGVKFYSYGGLKQQAAIWHTALSATAIQTIYRLSRNILTETSAARFSRVIGYSPFPTGLTNPTTNPTMNVGAFTTGGPTISNELEIVSDSEGGSLYVTKAGILTMTSRQDFAKGNSLTSQATIGTTGISIGPEIEYKINAENIRNQLAVGYSGDGSIEISDATSVAAYGVSGGSVTTQLTSQNDAAALAQFIVGFSKDPVATISPVAVNVAAVDTDWATVLGLELLERYTLTIAPRTGSAFTLPQLIQSIEHRVVPGQWSTTIAGSVLYTNPFIIGQSLLGGTDLLA